MYQGVEGDREDRSGIVFVVGYGLNGLNEGRGKLSWTKNKTLKTANAVCAVVPKVHLFFTNLWGAGKLGKLQQKTHTHANAKVATKIKIRF